MMIRVQPMTAFKWIEILFGCIAPTVLVVPFFLTILELGLYRFTQPQWSAVELFPAMAFSLIPIIAVGSIWMLVLFGPRQINRYFPLRLITLLFGVAGLLLVFAFFIPLFQPIIRGYWKESLGLFLKPYSFAFRTIVRGDDWRLLFFGTLGPLFVGLRALPVLIRGTQPIKEEKFPWRLWKRPFYTP
jgi:hypothetical protein